MENELEMWVLWMQTMELGTLQAVLEVGEEDEAGRWDAVVEQGLADRWEGSGGKDGEGALRRFLRGAVGVVYAEHSEAARKRAVEASWEGWGPTWEV